MIPMDDALGTGAAGFDKAGKLLYMIDSRERDTAALVSIEIASGKRAVVADDAEADVTIVRQHPTEKTLQAVAASTPSDAGTCSTPP